MDPSLIPALYDALMVARLGSVGAAARRLGKTPSAVSQQIRHLTEALSVPLFERRGRGLTPTAAAERLLPAATRLFDEAEAVFRLFGELGGAAATRLRIAASDYLGRPLVVPVLRGLVAERVPVAFEISTAHSEEALARLERGDVEMALVSLAAERAGLSARRLFEQPFLWVAPKRPAGADWVSPRQRLESEPVLRLAPGSLGRRLLDGYLAERALRPASIVDVPSISLVVDYLSGGIGVALVPALAVERADRMRLDIELADLPALPVALVTRRGRPLVPAVERFVERLEREAGRCREALRAPLTPEGAPPCSPGPAARRGRSSRRR
ncbi:MAG TPA: LysR family transcriptional regulator [Polyangiaceae bacterium]|nr:LysR family transcriptional regulator [Polyangiaceae bacterium]